jgi:hypothetical protein
MHLKRTEHTVPVGDHIAYLQKRDDTGSWGPEHADWVCERCGCCGETTTALRAQRCETREAQDG